MASLKRLSWVCGAAFLLCVPVACSPSGQGGEGPVKLQGAGAGFPAPLYDKWFQAYHAAHPDVQIDYQSVGSGSGVKAVLDNAVDFGASDAAMNSEEMKKVEAGVQLLPMTAGTIVLAYNVPGLASLKLSRDAYVGIFLGKITKWNDRAIASANPGRKLPDMKIHVVVRADSSGTTYVFTKHLSAVSEEFARNLGANKTPNWHVGTKANGNEGVAAAVNATPGSIGYVEYGYAIGAKLRMAALQNKAGKWVEPTIASGRAALAAAPLPEDMIVWVSDPEGDGSYPIAAFTWIICYKKYDDPKKAAALKDVLAYCLTEGQKASEPLGYIPLPDSVAEKLKAALGNIASGDGD